MFHGGGRLAAVGYADGTARLWDTVASLPVGPTCSQPAPLICEAFTDEGRTLLIASSDGLVREWQVPSWLTDKVDELDRKIQLHNGFFLDPGKVLVPMDEATSIRRQTGQFYLAPHQYWKLALLELLQMGKLPSTRRFPMNMNAMQHGVDWHFRIENARVKSKRLHLKIKTGRGISQCLPEGGICRWNRKP